MADSHTIEVPFKIRDGRQYLTMEQLLNNPNLLEFMNRFSECFERDENSEIYWFSLAGY